MWNDPYIFYFPLQSEAGTAKHFLQIIDNAESDYQVFQSVHSQVSWLMIFSSNKKDLPNLQWKVHHLFSKGTSCWIWMAE